MFLKATKLVSKGCVYHIVKVNKSTIEIRSTQNVSIVKELSLLREIDFDIDIIREISPTYFLPYRMELVELKEIKEKLKALLEKDFIPPSVSPWDTLVLFVRIKDEQGYYQQVSSSKD